MRTLSLHNTSLHANSPTLTSDELSQLDSGIQDWIVKLSNYLDSSVAAQSLPIIGKLTDFIATEKGELTLFGKTLSDILTKSISSNTTPTLSDVSTLINDGFKTAGIHASVNLTGNASAIRLNLEAGISGSYNQSLAADLGIGSVVSLNTAGTLKATAGIDFKLTCGVDGSGFYIDTKNNTYTVPGGTTTLLSGTSLTVYTNDTLGGISASGHLGPLAAHVSSSPASALSAAINLKLGTSLDGGLLRLNDFKNTANLTVTPELSGNLALDLNVATSIQKTVNKETLNLLPLTSEESIHWNFATQSSPDVALKKTTLALGPIFQTGGLVATILSNVATCAASMDPVVQALGKNIPGLPQSSFLALVASSPDLTLEQKQDISDFVKLIQNATTFLKDLPTVDPKATLRLPDYQINGIPSGSLPFANPQDTLSNATVPTLSEKETSLPIISQSVSDFLSKISLGSMGTLSLPVLADPQTLANLILGKETDLVHWDLPPISATFDSSIAPFAIYPPFPVSLAAAVNGSFTENLGIGYSSRGLIDYQKPENNKNPAALLDGIYLYNPQSSSTLPGPVLSASLAVTPELALGLGDALNATVSGTLFLKGGVTIDPDSLGNFYPIHNGTTDSLAPAFATAMIGGGIHARATVVGLTKEFDVVPNTVLYQAQFPANSLQRGPALTLSGGDLRLNIGSNSSLSGNFDNPVGGDTLKVIHYQGNQGSESIGISINNDPSVLYKATKHLTGSASSGSLTILDQPNAALLPVLTPIVFNGGGVNLTFVGGAANDTITMGDGDSNITPGTGAHNSIHVGNGSNIINLGLGHSTVSGGSHTTISYDLALTSPVSVNLTTGVLGGAAKGDHIVGIPNITGSHLGDTLIGGATSAGTLTGGRGNDIIHAGSAGETLVGALPGSSTPGRREIDTLTGDAGSDLFILGDAASVYYLSGSSRGGGKLDYALIRHFDPTKDRLQLKGDSSQYLEALLTINGQQGYGIYFDTHGGSAVSSTSELIALVEPDASHPLSSLRNIISNQNIARFV